MSAVAPLLKPLGLRPAPARSTGRAAKARPRLVVVAPARSSAGRLPFAILVGAVLVTGLVTLLMLHTIAAQDGFKVTALQARQTALVDQEQSLEQIVQTDSSPESLRAKAAALGMVPSVVNSYHRVRDGRAVGLEQPVIPAPVITTTTATKAGSKKAVSTKAATTKAATTKAATTKAQAPTKPHHQGHPHR